MDIFDIYMQIEKKLKYNHSKIIFQSYLSLTMNKLNILISLLIIAIAKCNMQQLFYYDCELAKIPNYNYGTIAYVKSDVGIFEVTINQGIYYTYLALNTSDIDYLTTNYFTAHSSPFVTIGYKIDNTKPCYKNVIIYNFDISSIITINKEVLPQILQLPTTNNLCITHRDWKFDPSISSSYAYFNGIIYPTTIQQCQYSLNPYYQKVFGSYYENILSHLVINHKFNDATQSLTHVISLQ